MQQNASPVTSRVALVGEERVLYEVTVSKGFFLSFATLKIHQAALVVEC